MNGKTTSAKGRRAGSIYLEPDSFAVVIPAVTAALLVGGVSFLMSWDALRVVATWAGIMPARTWGLPLSVDASILVFSALWLIARRRGMRTWFHILAVTAFTLGSVGGNVAHALAAGVGQGWQVAVGAVAAAAFPLTVFATTHAVAGLLVDPDADVRSARRSARRAARSATSQPVPTAPTASVARRPSRLAHRPRRPGRPGPRRGRDARTRRSCVPRRLRWPLPECRTGKSRMPSESAPIRPWVAGSVRRTPKPPRTTARRYSRRSERRTQQLKSVQSMRKSVPRLADSVRDETRTQSATRVDHLQPDTHAGRYPC